MFTCFFFSIICQYFFKFKTKSHTLKNEDPKTLRPIVLYFFGTMHHLLFSLVFMGFRSSDVLALALVLALCGFRYKFCCRCWCWHRCWGVGACLTGQKKLRFNHIFMRNRKTSHVLFYACNLLTKCWCFCCRHCTWITSCSSSFFVYSLLGITWMSSSFYTNYHQRSFVMFFN